MKYFTLIEFERSATAKRLGIDNSVPNEIIKNRIVQFVNDVLDPLREKMELPVLISSGYRCEELNNAVGGVKSSLHRQGYAADVYSLGFNWRIYAIVRESLPYTELIWYKSKGFVHIAYNPRMRKGKVTKIVE